MTWAQFFNQPKSVFGLIAAFVVIWLLFNPQTIAHLINEVIMPLLMQGLVIGLLIWAIKLMILGPNRKK